MKVLFMVIASPGLPYECFKAIWLLHWQTAKRWFPDAGLWFIHGQHSDTYAGGQYDRHYPVEESIIPGLLQKTMLAFKDFLESDYEFVIRTNLSSIFIWDRLRAYMEKWKDIADVAGFSETRDHFTGCNIILNRGVVQLLYENKDSLEYSVEDDLAISRFILKNDIRYTWAPRYDMIDNTIALHGTEEPLEIFHVRVKGSNRMQDVSAMYELVLAFKSHHGL